MDEKKKLPKELMTFALVMSLGSLPPMLDSTIVNIAINDLAKLFNTDLATMQWVVTGYVLALGIAVPFSGWLVKRFDGKWVYMGSVVLFIIGSMLTGISWNIGSLILFRIIQGAGSGILIPTLYTLLVEACEGKNIGRIMSIVGIPMIFGPIIGPIIGGLILEYASWHWLFYVNVPVCAIALLLMWKRMPKFPPTNKKAKFDWVGIILLVLISVALIYGIIAITAPGQMVQGILFIAAGLVFLIFYFLYARKKKEDALVPLDLFQYKNFSASFILLFLAGFTMNGPMLLLPMFFQNVTGLSILVSALWLLPQGIGVLVTRPNVGKFIDQIGARFIVLPAIILTIAGTMPFAFFNTGTRPWLVWLSLLVRGMGVGCFFIAVMSDSYVGVPGNKVPEASIAARIIQNIGAAFGSALLVTVVSDILARNADDVVTAYHDSFFVSLAFMAVAIIPTFFLTNRIGKKKLREYEKEIQEEK